MGTPSGVTSVEQLPIPDDLVLSLLLDRAALAHSPRLCAQDGVTLAILMELCRLGPLFKLIEAAHKVGAATTRI